MTPLAGKLKAVVSAREGSAERGASFAIALVFALLVAFIAAVTISSASVNAERSAVGNLADDQGYLAVVSALGLAGDLVERDVCAANVTVGADKSASVTPGTDRLGLAEWARAQVQSIARGGSSQPKHVVVSASAMGLADVPDVLVTFTLNDGGIFARACIDVWAGAAVPADDAVLKSDLVARSAYADYLTKQVASCSGISGSLPRVVTWASTGAPESEGGLGGQG